MLEAYSREMSPVLRQQKRRLLQYIQPTDAIPFFPFEGFLLTDTSM